MKYIYIEEEAVKYLISNREYQSIEYNNAKILVSFLKHGGNNTLGSLDLIKNKEIGYIFNYIKFEHKRAIIFDLTFFTGFKTKGEDQIITIFQKILRFAIKHWESLPTSSSEKYLENNHAVVFPFPLTGGDSYRVLLNLSPSAKFTETRDLNYIAVSGDGIQMLEDSDINIPFKRIKVECLEVCKEKKNTIATSTSIKSLSVHSTEEIERVITPMLGYEGWLRQLTQNQRKFVEQEINGPERLEGAAGTGKTLSLILRAIYNIKTKIDCSSNFNMIFIAHSIATKKQIENIFLSNYPEISEFYDRHYTKVSIEITTLQEWCANSLGGKIEITEILDIDAQSAKEMQLMYLEEAYDSCIKSDLSTYKLFCSNAFIDYLYNNQKEVILEMLQAEIAISIKGRAEQDIEKYRNLNQLENSIPMEIEGDYNFIFLIYERYQKMLLTAGSFDSDDVILSALSQLNTPLWRRRRNMEGYDAIFIDETHLFNYNELSIFHHLCKEDNYNIIFAVDKTQAIGDRGFTNTNLSEKMHLSLGNNNYKYQTVFRSSPDIVNLAFHILSSGTTLFTTFDNPLDKVSYSFTIEEERKSEKPKYLLKENDDIIIQDAFKSAEEYHSKSNILRNDILIIAATNQLLEGLKKYADMNNKPYEILRQRGDIEIIKSAEKKNRFVLGLIDFVGGLEFDMVIIIGVDKDRVPPVNDKSEGYYFQSYTWHNRMYVAVSRAKYILKLMGDKTRGVSSILKNAIDNKSIDIVE